MRVINTEKFPDGKEIDEELGLVTGNSVKSGNFWTDLVQNFKNLAGGDLKGYEDLLSATRNKAIEIVKQEAEELGADAVVNLRLDTYEIAGQGSEVVAYGTAVTIQEDEE